MNEIWKKKKRKRKKQENERVEKEGNVGVNKKEMKKKKNITMKENETKNVWEWKRRKWKHDRTKKHRQVLIFGNEKNEGKYRKRIKFEGVLAIFICSLSSQLGQKCLIYKRPGTCNW